MDERKNAIQSLKVAKGQIEGIINMIEDERYCVDISNQIIAVQSLLKKANIIDSHQGNNGYKLKISADKLTLLKIYQAVSEENRPHLFDIHLNPNDKCLVGANIKPVLNDMFTDLEDEFAKELEKRTLLDCINEIRKRL